MSPIVTDLGAYRRQRQAASSTAKVEVLREVDPECANRSYYFVISEDRSAVQSAIDGLMAEVESFGSGYGEFLNPRRQNGLWFAFGEVFVRPDVIQEFWK